MREERGREVREGKGGREGGEGREGGGLRKFELRRLRACFNCVLIKARQKVFY